MRVLGVALVFLSSKVAATGSCGSAALSSQSDADSLVNSCPTVTGDIIPATSAAGVISLDGVQVIDGNLASENCNSACASLLSFTSSSLESLNVNTNLDSFILRDYPDINHQGFSLSTPRIEYLEIGGSILNSSDPPIGLTIDLSSIVTIGTLNMTGCQVLVTDGPTIIDTMILANNPFATFFLDSTKILNNLTIVDNGNLNEALLLTDMQILNINIRRNDALQSSGLFAGTELWPWGIANISSMILDGSFEPSFFRDYNNLTLVEISKEFSLTSTDHTFDCTYLNSLRTQGDFQGNYSCQGKTVAAEHVRTTSRSSRSTFVRPVLPLVVSITLSIACFVL